MEDGPGGTTWREGMNAPLYTTEILRLAASLGMPRALEREDGRAELRSPTCGSRYRVAVQLDETAASRRFRSGARLRVRPGVGGVGRAAGAVGRSRTSVEGRCTTLSRLAGGEQR